MAWLWHLAEYLSIDTIEIPLTGVEAEAGGKGFLVMAIKSEMNMGASIQLASAKDIGSGSVYVRKVLAIVGSSAFYG